MKTLEWIKEKYKKVTKGAVMVGLAAAAIFAPQKSEAAPGGHGHKEPDKKAQRMHGVADIVREATHGAAVVIDAVKGNEAPVVVATPAPAPAPVVIATPAPAPHGPVVVAHPPLVERVIVPAGSPAPRGKGWTKKVVQDRNGKRVIYTRQHTR